MASKLAHDVSGRLVVVVSTASAPKPPGTVLLVLGNEIGSCPGGTWGFTGRPSGRPAEPCEQPKPQPQARPGGGVRRSYPVDFPERARELHAQGLSCPKVADEMGIPFATAKYWIWNQRAAATT